MSNATTTECCQLCGRAPVLSSQASNDLKQRAIEKLQALPADITFITLSELADYLVLPDPSRNVLHILGKAFDQAGWKHARERRPYTSDYHLGYARPSTTAKA